MSSVWWVEYSGRRMLIVASSVDAADDEAIRRFGRIPDAVYPADEDPAFEPSDLQTPAGVSIAGPQTTATAPAGHHSTGPESTNHTDRSGDD